jgi:hypothetical protein
MTTALSPSAAPDRNYPLARRRQGQKRPCAITGRWNGNLAKDVTFTALLAFADGTPATLVFNGYGFFDITELT